MIKALLVVGALVGVVSVLANPADIGTAHPIGGVIAPPNGRWFILCQARHDTDRNGSFDSTYDIHTNGGDLLEPYLVLGTGAGTMIDYPAARSKRGDWLAVVERGTLHLIDAATYQREKLDVDVVNDHWWMTDHNARFISIAANGSRMTYLKGNTITIRDLATRAERRITVKDKLWRADVDASGRWARVMVMRSDTDRDGKIDWPGGANSDSLSRCSVDTLHHHNPEGDQPTTLWLDLKTGAFVEDSTVVMPLGEVLLRRRADGALSIDGTVLVDGDCNAKVEATIPSPPRIAFTCGSKEGREDDRYAVLQIAGQGFARKKTSKRTFRFETFSDRRFQSISDSKGKVTHYIDIVDGSEIALPGEWKSEHENFVLVKTKTDWLVLDLTTRKTIKLAATGDKADGLFELVDIGTSTFDLRTGKRVGAAAERIVLVDPTGRTLLRVGPSAPPGHFGTGPLRWR